VLLTRSLEHKLSDFGRPDATELGDVRALGKLAFSVWVGPFGYSVRVTYRELIESCHSDISPSFEEVVNRMGAPGFPDSWVDDGAFNAYRRRVSSPRVPRLAAAVDGGDCAAQVRLTALVRDKCPNG
jgi:hypothetical protein